MIPVCWQVGKISNCSYIMFAKKSLGQHFLMDKRVLASIADAVGSAGRVVEIGPGHGELTHELLARHNRVTVIEKDDVLSLDLVARAWDDVRVVHGDALAELSAQSSLCEASGEPYVIAGNIPYYITGHLLRIIGELPYKPVRTVLLIQKEVAERITMHEHRMNLLAASVLWWAQPRIGMVVPRGAFVPPPKVDSAVLILDTRGEAPGQEETNAYYAFIHALFKQPRKTIYNNLGTCVSDKDELLASLQRAGVNPSDRAHQLSFAMLKTLLHEFHCF